MDEFDSNFVGTGIQFFCKKQEENIFSHLWPYKVKFIYSEKATKFCEIFPLLLTPVHTVKGKGKISQNFVAFSEYMKYKKKPSRTANFIKQSNLYY